MAYETIRYEVRGNVGLLTLARPEQLNAFTSRMVTEMCDAFDRADVDDAVRALVVTGDGRAFCAGADISGGAAGFRDNNADASSGSKVDYSQESARDMAGFLALRIYDFRKPVIAAINGPAVGVGATMLLPMDIRLASENARFGFVFTRRGIVPEGASGFFLPRVVGIEQALEWCYTGRVFDAQEAKTGGLVSRVLPPDDLLPTAFALAQEIAENTAPISIALTRQLMWRGLGLTHPMQAHRVDSRAIMSRSTSADAQEGVASFLEKRPARFTDKVSQDLPDFYPWWEEESYF